MGKAQVCSAGRTPRTWVALAFVLLLSGCGPMPKTPAWLKGLEPDTRYVPVHLGTVRPSPTIWSVTLRANTRVPVARVPSKTVIPAVTTTPSPTIMPAATLPPSVTPLPLATATRIRAPYAASFESDITIPDGTVLLVSQHYDKVWAIRNTGTAIWTDAVRLRNLDSLTAANPSHRSEVTLSVVQPGEVVQITAPMVAPSEPGVYRSTWQLWVDGTYFGPKLTVEIACVTPHVENTVEAPPPPVQTGPSATCLEVEAYLRYIDSYCRNQESRLLVARDVQGLTELRAWCDSERRYALDLRSIHCAP